MSKSSIHPPKGAQQTATPPQSTKDLVEASKKQTNEKADIEKAKDQLGRFRGFIDSLKPNIVAAIGKWLTPDMVVSQFYSAVRAQPKLMDCSPSSLAGCILQAAQLRLRLDPLLGQAYMIPFWNKDLNRHEAQLIPGYRGFIAKMVDDKRIIAVDGQVVRQNDEFDFERGANLAIKHKHKLGEDRGEIIGAYVVVYGPGMKILQFEVMDLEQLETIRAQSRNKDGTAYKEHTDEMYRKAPIRRVFKMLPFRDPDLERLVALDEMGIEGQAQGFDIELLDDEGKPVIAPWEEVGAKEAAEAQSTADTKQETKSAAEEAEKARLQAQVVIYLQNKIKEPANINRMNDIRQEIDVMFVDKKISQQDHNRLIALAEDVEKAALPKKAEPEKK